MPSGQTCAHVPKAEDENFCKSVCQREKCGISLKKWKCCGKWMSSKTMKHSCPESKVAAEAGAQALAEAKQKFTLKVLQLASKSLALGAGGDPRQLACSSSQFGPHDNRTEFASGQSPKDGSTSPNSSSYFSGDASDDLDQPLLAICGGFGLPHDVPQVQACGELG